MNYKVNITHSAETDLLEIYKYIFTNDSAENAEKIFSKLYKKCLSLVKYPGRGHIPPELKLLELSGFLEIAIKPYRIIYQVIEKTVYIHCVLDGRRDMQKLLQERLIRE